MSKRKEVIDGAEAVSTRLAQLGLTEDQLLHAARRWFAAWSTFTPNHPPVGIGIACWTEAVAALREQLLPVGWTRSDEKNYALVINADRSLAINVAAGDAGTGNPSATPTNKAPKGVTTADAIDTNQQLAFDFPVPESAPPVEGELLTWFLLLYRSAHEIRAELSLPAAMSEDGRITRWHERLILRVIPLDPDDIDIDDADGPVLEIDVKRKA